MKKSLLVGDFFVAPGGAAEWAVVGAGVILVAGELAVFTEGGEVEVIAVAIEAVFGEIFVVVDVVLGAEFLCFSPGARFDFEELDIRTVVVLADQIVAELVEKEELSFGVGVFGVCGVKKRARRSELEAAALGNGEVGVVVSELFDEILHRGSNLGLQRKSRGGPWRSGA